MSKCRVLIVEDDPLVSAHIEAVVIQSVAADVVIGASVAEARAVTAIKPNFAFLDVDVLDGTTYAFASALRAQGVPFAFVSASNRDKIPVELQSAPFISKPYSDADIVAMVRTMLASRADVASGSPLVESRP